MKGLKGAAASCLFVMSFAPCASASLKSDCETYCAAESHCTHCSTLYYCGSYYETLKHFTGWGRNYHACSPSGSVNPTWPSTSVAQSYHRTLVVTLGGSGASSGDDGLEWFCEDYLSGSNGDASILCLSSWAAVTTASATLADNIAEMVGAIESKSGARPSVILVGKSMGGCKLHHAMDNLEADGVSVDLFVGVDMSCSVDRHWEDGMSDAEEFPYSVEEMVVFYQNKAGESQTGFAAVYEGETSIDYGIHVDVNSCSWDVPTHTKACSSNLCDNVGHMEIDDCSNLMWTIHDLIYDTAY